LTDLKLLIGTDLEIIINFITEITELDEIGDGELKVFHAWHDYEIVETADNNDIDIFILQLNNILYHGDYTSTGDFRTQALEFIAYIKKKYNKPIIAFTVFDELAEKSIKAGATAFLKMPFTIKEYQSAMEKCLNR